jgi:putative flavoprotein involved in K+ transport
MVVLNVHSTTLSLHSLPCTIVRTLLQLYREMFVDTVIIGGGFCGVNIALHLQEKKMNGADDDDDFDYLIVEKDTLLSQWKTARWDDFQLNTPHVANRLYGQVDDLNDSSLGQDFKNQELAIWQQHIAKNNLRYKEHCTVVSVQTLQTLPTTEKDMADSNNNDRRSRFVIELEPTMRKNDNAAEQKKEDGGEGDDHHHDITSRTTLTCRNVICCSGQCAVPKIPFDLSCKLKEMQEPIHNNNRNHIVQMHSSEFKGPQQFPDDNNRAILVVGSGQSGVQIADLLADHGKRVWLCTSDKAAGVYRSFRGEDLFVWTLRRGFFQTTNEMRQALPNSEALRYKMNPVVGSARPISYASLARKSVQILGSLQDVQNDQFIIANNRLEHVQHLTATYEASRELIREWIASQPDHVVATFAGLPETLEPEYEPEPSLLEDNGPLQLSLDDCQGVIWCTGYTSSVHSYLYKIPPRALAVDMDARTGSPDVLISETTPGLYYAGFPWVRTAGSAILLGFDADAKVLVDHLVSERRKG